MVIKNNASLNVLTILSDITITLVGSVSPVVLLTLITMLITSQIPVC